MEISKEALAWTIGLLAVGASVITAGQLELLGSPPGKDLVPVSIPRAEEAPVLQWEQPVPADVPSAQVVAFETPAIATLNVENPAAVAQLPAPEAPALPGPVASRAAVATVVRTANIVRPPSSALPPATWPTPKAAAAKPAAQPIAKRAKLSNGPQQATVALSATPPASAAPVAATTQTPAFPQSEPATPAPIVPTPVTPTPIATTGTAPAVPATSRALSPPTTILVVTYTIPVPTVAPTVPPTTAPIRAALTAATLPPTTKAPTTTVAPPTTLAGPATTVPKLLISATPTQATATVASGPLTYRVGNGGSVVVDATAGTLSLLASLPEPGAVAVVSNATTTALTISFLSSTGSGSASATLSLAGNQLTYQS
jgi:hypothetical protein